MTAVFVAASPPPHRALNFGRIPRSTPSDSRHLNLLVEQTAAARLDRNAVKRFFGLVPELVAALAQSVWSDEPPAAGRVTHLDASDASADDLNGSARRLAASKLANETLRIWQERLGFLHWQIRIEVVPRSALRRGTVGHVEWQHPGSASISVIDAAAYAHKPCSFAADMEETIVHELVHLHLAFQPGMQKSGKAEEAIVEQISDALLQLDRVQSGARCH